MLSIPEYKDAARVFHYFEEISKIPRGSYHTAAIAAWLAGFAKEHGLPCLVDKNNNVVIRKPATPGYENHPGVVLQGHTDMVAEKTADCKKDMEHEGLDLFRDGDFLRAKGTTLGGDDGVAVAYALAVLEAGDIPHPALEVLFTSDEEVGMLGATALDGGVINGRRMINIDSDDEGVFTVGCAGGVRVNLSLPVTRVPSDAPRYALELTGLTGGHSGAEIHLGRANATLLLAKLLSDAGVSHLLHMNGGTKDNAIPRTATATVACDEATANRLTALAEKTKETVRATDPGMRFSLTPVKSTDPVLNKESTDAVLSLLLSLPNGIVAMSRELKDTVETSLNLGILNLNETSLDFSYSIRSAKATEKEALFARITGAVCAAGGSFDSYGDYPAWEYRTESPLRDTMCRIYRDLYQKDPTVLVIHAGLECGLLSEKLPGLDCVSIGPDNFDIHTTEEHLSISSTARVYDYLKAVLAAL